MKKLIPILLCLAILLCSCGGETADNGEITVVATLFPQYDYACEIAGERVKVEMLLDFGADAHSYEPTPADIVKIAKADLFIYTGAEMEMWAAELLESADVKKAIESGSLKVLDLSEHVELIPMHEHDDEHEHEDEHEHSEYDSHIWTSASNAKAMCEAIAASITEIDKDGEDVYAANLASYREKLDTLSAKAVEVADTATRDTVYFGGSFAFRYLFDEMGLSHVSIYEGCASHAEPSAAALTKMVEQIKESGAKYVLYDTPSEEKIAVSIAAECGAEVLHLHAVHNITKAEFDAGENYLTLMEKNIETLGKALS